MNRSPSTPNPSPSAPPAPPAPLVTIKNLVHSYGSTRALNGIDLKLFPAEILVMVGLNGAGKSTLIKIVLGLLHPSAGTVDLEPEVRKRGRIGFLPEETALPLELTGRELLAWHVTGAFPNETARPIGRRLEETAERLGITRYLDRRISRCSKGMARRVALGLAVVTDPHLLVLDEPQSGLDPNGRSMLYRLVEQFRRRNAAVLVSTHDLEMASRIATRLTVLHQGRLLRKASAPLPARDLESLFATLSDEPRPPEEQR
ncbi:MAG: ATP-binding cassette domain-containing protein [Candidatus Hydrogenedentota bacterium]|nr:MAG: ATP-binding cassette domain-containing protein [Candidatus Hydrogenedentota bacterium]